MVLSDYRLTGDEMSGLVDAVLSVVDNDRDGSATALAHLIVSDPWVSFASLCDSVNKSCRWITSSAHFQHASSQSIAQAASDSLADRGTRFKDVDTLAQVIEFSFSDGLSPFRDLGRSASIALLVSVQAALTALLSEHTNRPSKEILVELFSAVRIEPSVEG
jgi:hypothetical protein